MHELAKPRLRGETLKQSILDTALTLFSEKGYFNTSVHDIRKAAGVSIGAIYHHFGNKEALAKALYESLLQQVDDAVEEASRVEIGCRAQSRSIIEKLFLLTLEKPLSMQFILLAQHRQYLPDEAPICSSSPFQTMKKVVMQGMANREIRNMDAWVAATTMFGGALRMMNLQLDGVLERPLTEYSEEVVDCAWRALDIT